MCIGTFINLTRSVGLIPFSCSSWHHKLCECNHHTLKYHRSQLHPGGCPQRRAHSAQRRQVPDPRPGRGGQVQPHRHVPQHSARADPHQHPGRHTAHPPDTHPRHVHLEIHCELGDGELRPTVSHDRPFQLSALPQREG